MEIEYPNLKMINVSHFTVQHILFARQSNIIETVHDMKSLTDYVIRTGSIVGFLRGSKKAQHLLSKLPKKNMFALNSPEKGFELLTKERIAFYLAGPGIVNKAILKEKYNHSGIQEICVLSETQLFPYVNVNHISIIPQLEAVLQSMLDDGTMGRIRNLLE